MKTTAFSTLSESKQAMLQQRLRAARESLGRAAQTIPPRHRLSGTSDVGGPIPLSYLQQQFWFFDQLAPGNAAYAVFEAVRLEGQTVSVPVLERSFTEIIRRHEVLRTTFQVVEGQTVQVISPPVAFHMPVDDLRHLPPGEREEEARRLAVAEAQRPFDLGKDLMLRARLVRLGEHEHWLLINMHHIASDGWSLGILYKELSELYRAESADALPPSRPPSLPELPIQFSDYAFWERTASESTTELAYWREKLADAPDLLALPSDHPRPPTPTFRGRQEWFTVPATVIDQLKSVAREEGATLFMVLAAAFKTLLQRYTGQTDLVVGTTVAGRTWWETEPLIGPFINALPLRTDLSGDPPFRALLQRIRATTLEAYAHQNIPLELLVQALKPKRSVPHLPLFQTMLILQSVPTHNFSVPGLRSSRTEVDNGTAKFDLTFSMTETPAGLVTMCEYSTDLFEPATARRMVEHFQTLLGGIAAQPDARLSEVPLLSERERTQVLECWSAGVVESSGSRLHYSNTPLPHSITPGFPSGTVHGLFEKQAERTPERVALRFRDEQVTYSALNERANRLAESLMDRGVGPEGAGGLPPGALPLVGVCMERSVEMVVALLAILKAGGAYVPMDPAYPEERLRYIAEDAGIGLLLTNRALQNRVSIPGVEPIYVENVDVKSSSGWKRQSNVGPNNLAYVIYTSGSTGKPKGVAIEHSSVVSFLHWGRQQFSDQELSGVLFATSICFDLSVFELFTPLSWGGKAILVENALDWLSLGTFDVRAEVTLVNTVPSVAREWVRTGSLPGNVRTVNLAGEPLAQELVEELYERFPKIDKVYDLYGPTEDTVYSTCALRTPGGRANIGRPISNKEIYLLDGHQQPVPIGVPGELHIGGPGLARGYLHRPELTAERFVPNPFRTLRPAMVGRDSVEPPCVAPRLYKTGDLARYRSDGTIEYLGRLDNQVKIRGFRFEPGEIEGRLRQHSAVGEAAVVAVDDCGGQRLAAYLVLKSPVDTGELRNFLRKSLPDYMVPAAFIRLESLPLTPNGKLNRKALPAPDSMPKEAEPANKPPASSTERLLAEIWCEVLKLPQVHRDDSFFEVGGHSILAMQVASRIKETFQCDLPVRHLFESPTIAELARVVEDKLLKEIQGLSDAEAEQMSGDMQVAMKE